MNKKSLYLFVEGNDDEMFFERVLIPKFEEKYLIVMTWKYSQKSKKEVRNFLKGIRSLHAKGLAESIFVADLDESESVRAKKENLLSEYEYLSKMDQECAWSRSWIRLLIVCKEIESWYLAGLGNGDYAQIGIKEVIGATDKISKEEFNRLIPPKKLRSRIDFMQEVLKVFRIDVACSKNSSFNYLIRNSVDFFE